MPRRSGQAAGNDRPAAVLALVACLPAAAQEHCRLHTATELARLCATPTSERDHATAIAFCHGVLAGSDGHFRASTPAAGRFVCPPKPSVTRTQVAIGFVAWLKARPQHNNTVPSMRCSGMPPKPIRANVEDQGVVPMNRSPILAATLAARLNLGACANMSASEPSILSGAAIGTAAGVALGAAVTGEWAWAAAGAPSVPAPAT
jgi:Rap1a immunity proteins